MTTIHGSNLINWTTGTDQSDAIYGHGHDDKLLGRLGNDYLDGGTGNDNLQGGKGNDTLIGGDGHDKLYGKADNDRITGGNGADMFFFGGGMHTSVDVITDFDPTEGDRLLLQDVDTYRFGSIQGHDGTAVSFFSDNATWLGAVVLEGNLTQSAVEGAIWHAN